MIEVFRTQRFNKKSVEMLKQINGIIQEYAKMGIRITLRQLYYQLVSRDLLANHVKEYHRLSALTTNARYTGLIDWHAIEDRIRVPRMASEWDNVQDLIESARASYRLPRWEGQDYYVELFTEKDALSSVLAPIAHEHHIHFCVNRGYTSATAIYDLSKRILGQVQEGKEVKILYLGDYDPSGLDMVRDITDRLKELCEEGDRTIDFDASVEVRPIALTKEQIKQYNPPPNPAKKTDPRSKWFMRVHGATSWEVDALPPDVMMRTVRREIQKYLDMDLYNAIIEKEKQHMAKLGKLARRIK